MIELSPLPEGVTATGSSLVHIDRNNIAYAPPDRSAGILTFDVGTDRWTMLSPYSRRFRPSNASDDGYPAPNPIAYDGPSNTLYVATENAKNVSSITSIDRDSGAISVSKTLPVSFQYPTEHSILSIGGDIHFISRRNDSHCVWSGGPEDSAEITPIGTRQRFAEFAAQWESEWTSLGEEISEHFLVASGGASVAVHVPSKNTILLLGGAVTNVLTMEIDVVRESFEGVLESDGRWHWERVEGGKPVASPNAVVSRDQKHVIVCDVGRFVGGMDDNIYILDSADNFKWRRSEIKRPLSGSMAELMFRTGDREKSDVTVHGFIKRQCREIKTLQMMPMVLITVIRCYFSEELIHWANERQHVAIPLLDILSAPSHKLVNDG